MVRASAASCPRKSRAICAGGFRCRSALACSRRPQKTRRGARGARVPSQHDGRTRRAGAVLASFIGTMGASMVLIRPLLRANSERIHQKHTVIFFIFAVSNVGGLLTPLGDPPLFLGFLRGVPFTWTLHLYLEWLVVVAVVLAAYAALEL